MIHTYADGFGIWHALVPDTNSARRIARNAIREELRMRGEGTKNLRIRAIPCDSGIHGYAHYMEV